ncbi:T9SS type A sorting domain-containing protein [Flavobacterium silvisoli]|uniref:T9SS type A sorting domain-containing protein n=1 Tax=Flavobacterium silvisoli TaxID=2529433 RepID=A0A4Q9Z3W1_9FLAO|nr:T9SS type A sorting domain-containing protein [Flavobacterium silvisoli]TBX71128.1 T9SS type A sorting domain-containing protein [Flavobacterium silvisoli]
MRKIYFVAISLLFFNLIQGQIINIPDANFKAKLLSASALVQVASIQTPNLSGNVSSYNSIDTNNDGEIQVSEALVIKYLNINSGNIMDLTGIENFTNLVNLNCSTNQLTTLNISALTNLVFLNCSVNQLSALNVTNLTSLLSLDCSSNLLPVLNLTGLGALNTLKCSNNQLTSLNISNINYLTLLDFSNNAIQNINLSSAVSLESLSMGANPYTAQVNLSNLINLQFLYLQNLPSNAISPLTVSVMPHLTSLTSLTTDGSALGNINYALLPNLQTLFCRNSGLTNMNGIPNTLSVFVCQNNQLTSLNLTGFSNLTALNFANNPLTSLTFGNHPNLITMFAGQTNLTTIDVSNLPALSSLSVYNSPVLITCNIKNGINTTMSFNLCPNLQCITADSSEISTVQNNIITYGYTNCSVSSNCSLQNDDFERYNTFRLYPNPAVNILNIEANSSTKIKSIIIYNILGQVVNTINNAEDVSSIDISNLIKGSYLIKLITTDGGNLNMKFVKE